MFTSTAASRPFRRRVVLGAASALAALSFGAADASAATVGRIFGGDLTIPGNDKLVYEGAAGADDLTITKNGMSMTFEDPTQTIVPTDAWCIALTDHKAVCSSIQGMPAGIIASVQTSMGEGDDTVQVLSGGGIGVSVDGQQGADTLMSGDAGHMLIGGDDGDTLLGGGGDDVLLGDGGADDIDAGAGEDEVYGGAAADDIITKDGETDQVDCGGGMDDLEADDGDARSACELVTGLQLAPPPGDGAPQDPPAGEQPSAPAGEAGAPASGEAPAGVPSPGPAAVAARRLRVAVTPLKLTRSGRLLVRVRCPKTAAGVCRVKLSGRGVAPRAVSVKPGAARTVVLKLTGARKRSAAKGRRVGVSLAVRAADAQVRASARTLRIARRAR